MKKRAREQISELVNFYERLSPMAQRALWVLLVIEAALVVGAERDIQRQSSQRIRGPKFVWRVVATQNVIGPAAYYFFGRRQSR